MCEKEKEIPQQRRNLTEKLNEGAKADTQMVKTGKNKK